ncbi:ChrR Cupin-like domain protein [Grimontia celer]|uniref:ChrR Cupin-like domain protein n=1 Tax=Grimontia celer TaxID=1796497 RepID=A0A128F7Z6_9GAMM|nr:cupin domain-containing protein [Grimontia celer]CZF82927.1 ChrR Cupin-like domain protein [Grimontia celer]
MTTDTKTASQEYIEWNVDLSAPISIKGGSLPFSDTPMVGVKRMMFERRGDEIARRATSCVRYAPGSSFKPHSHPGGEEYVVLEGTFSDQNGDFTKGWYVRNPVGSTHAPFTKEGCEIFVKLSQVPSTEPDYFYLNTNEADWTSVSELHKTLSLWDSDLEETSLNQLKAGYQSTEETFDKVVEYFVLSGSATINGTQYEHHSWMRFPANTPVTIATNSGAMIYRKIGAGEVRV